MRAPEDRELLAVWDRAVNRHPIDRGLLLGAWARPDLEPEFLADLPLGALNATLLRLRETWFGPRLEAFADCQSCGTRTEIALSVPELLASAPPGDGREVLHVAGFRFRVPDSRDLASVARDAKLEDAALFLLERCCVEGPGDATLSDLAAVLAEVEAGMEQLDPPAHFELNLFCEDCGARWTADLDVPGLVWGEIDARAQMLLTEVHTLARAYGWSESEILSLPRPHRHAYLELASS